MPPHSARDVRIGLCTLLLLATSFCLTHSQSHSAEIVRLGEYPYVFDEIPHLLLRGQIHVGDTSKVEHAIDLTKDTDEGSNAVISFNSPGGNMEEGIKIGNFLANGAVATVMRKGERCVSACALAFLGGRSFWSTGGIGHFLGRYLEPGAQLGFHSTTFDSAELAALAAEGKFTVPVEMTRVSLKTLAAYLEESGVSSPAIIDVLGTSYSDMKYINSSNDLFSFNINTTPIDISALNVKDAIYSACEKMLAATQKARVKTSTYLDRDDYKVHTVGKDEFLGFTIRNILYVMFACGVHLTHDEAAKHRENRLDVPALEDAIRNKIARLYQAGYVDLEIKIIASDDGGYSYRAVSTLRIGSGPWSTLTPTSAHEQGFTSYYPLAYWLVPGDIPFDRWHSAGIWTAK